VQSSIFVYKGAMRVSPTRQKLKPNRELDYLPAVGSAAFPN